MVFGSMDKTEKILMKRFTEKQLMAILPKLKGEHAQAIKNGLAAGLKKFHIDMLRTILGYTQKAYDKIDQKTIQKAIQLYDENPDLSAYQLWKKYGKKIGICDYQKYYAILRKAGIDTNRKRCFWTKFKDARLIEAREKKKMTFEQIARLFNNERKQNAIQLHYAKLKKAGKCGLQGNVAES